MVYGALGGALFLVPVVLQEVCGYSPLEAGMALLPLTVIMLALSAQVGRARRPDRPAAADDGRAAA